MKVIVSLMSFLLGTTLFLNAMEPATIHVAAQDGNLASVQRFLEQDATLVNNQSFSRDTPLHLAAYYGHEAVSRLLLNHGALFNLKNSSGYTPLALAIVQGHESIALLFLNRPVLINEHDDDGITLLHLASRSGLEAVVRLLLDHGALASQQNIGGLTALDIASMEHHDAIVHLLKQWQHIPKLRAARLAFCGVLHPRLGINSQANILPQPVLREILQYLNPEDFAAVNYQPAQHPVRSILGPRCAQVVAATTTLTAALVLWLLCHH